MKTISSKKTNQQELIKQAVTVLEKGGVIVYPTETCYGLGADATSPSAVDKIIKFKGFRKRRPISVAVADIKMAQQYATLNPTANNIFTNLLPGPITVVCRGKHKVDPRLEDRTGTLGLRMPDHSLVSKIVSSFGRPITATSANITSQKTPYSITDITDNTSKARLELIDLVIDAGQLPRRPPSAVVDACHDQPEILRQGKIDFSQIEATAVVSHSVAETKKLAANLTKKYLRHSQKPLVFALQGELGAGKTRFAKGIGKALGIKQIIKSPTFSLVHQYSFDHRSLKRTFFHLDAWRLETPQELTQLGLGSMLEPNNVIAIEWIEKGKKILEKMTKNKPVKIVWIEIESLGKTKRRIRFTE